MSHAFEIAHKVLLDPYDITEKKLQEVLRLASGKDIDIADIYFEYYTSEHWVFEDGFIRSADFTIDKGVGIRSVSGVKTGFAYANDLSLTALKEAARKARGIASSGSEGRVNVLQKTIKHNLYSSCDPLYSLSEEDKVKFLQEVGAEAYQQDSRIAHVSVHLVGSYKVIFVVGNDNVMAADVLPLARLYVTATAQEGKRYEIASAGGGGRTGYNFFIDKKRGLEFAREAARLAILNLSAINAPAGVMPVVLASGWPGVLLHEAVGHGLEGDFIRKGSSAFTGRIGEKVACSECTIVDNGSLPDSISGSINIDDEGTPSQNNVLIENGILKGFMYDKLNALATGNKATGNGRRQSYARTPLPRMTNTYMLSGKHTKEEIISSVKKGIYAVNFVGGEVDITSGKFVFSTSEAYLLENGKITHPIKGATLIGDGPKVLTKVSMVGNDLCMDSGMGVCGKESQNLPVCVGQPTLKIDELIVGGTG